VKSTNYLFDQNGVDLGRVEEDESHDDGYRESCNERSDEWKVVTYVRRQYNIFAVAVASLSLRCRFAVASLQPSLFASLLAPPHLYAKEWYRLKATTLEGESKRNFRVSAYVSVLRLRAVQSANRF